MFLVLAEKDNTLMSAICGLFQRNAGEVLHELIAMLAALTAYGPDGSAHWKGGTAGLGLQKTWVTPESQQDRLPRHDCDLRLAITADVRLDNRQSLSQALGIPYPERARLRDSELILRAYRRWGQNCPTHLLGDFAIAIWDLQTQELFCARDHIGAKPFYYYLTAERFAFASDIKGLLALPGISHQLDEAYIAASLLDTFFTSPQRTFFQSICKLPPGHSLTVGIDDVCLRQYWFPERAPEIRYQTDAEYTAAFIEIYTQAIHDRLRCVHSLGVHLSGGLDSSSIAVLAARELRRQGRPIPPAFCWQPPPTSDASTRSEYALIQAVCSQEGMEPHYQSPRPADILSIFRRDETCEPTEGALFHELTVQKQAAARGVRVLLSGWGGDEGVAFNGRGYYSELLLQRRWRQLFQASKERADHPWKFILMEAILPLVHTNAAKFVKRVRNGQWPSSRTSLIQPDFAKRLKPMRSVPYRQIGVRQTQLNLLTGGHISARIEAWAASGAQYNIVYCYPLLDRRVLEFALGLPPEQFRRGRWNRWLMRNALQEILPFEVCWNPSKVEPIRVQAVLDAIPEALEAIKHSLASRPVPPKRAGYVDMPRLVEPLDPERFRAQPKLGRIRAVLQFLDIE